MLTTRLTERAVINVSVADIGIQPGGGQLKLHAIQHHRPQQSLAGLGHLSQRPNKPWPFHSFQIRHTCKHVIATLVVAMNAILPPLVVLSQQHGPLRQIPRGPAQPSPRWLLLVNPPWQRPCSLAHQLPASFTHPMPPMGSAHPFFQ